jgi:hypothetical protein
MLRSAALLFLLTLCSAASAQNTRLREDNTIGWVAGTATLQTGKKWGVHLEYQWRRADGLSSWQQSLLRAGVNYTPLPGLTLQAGAAWIETFPYGTYPINGFGKTFPEYRLHQQAVLSNRLGRVDISHRFRLEERWIAKYNNAASESPDSYTFLTRVRYMPRVQVPLQGATLDPKEWYAAAFDEVLIGFGKNVGENIFDQNRIFLGGGYKFSSSLRAEIGYFQQIVQLGREIGGSNVFQYNNGVLLSGFLNADLRRKKPQVQ